MNNNFAIIMAGGVGSRFWPLSQTAKPKQFLDILGTGKTLLQETFDRLKKLIPESQIFIVTNEIYEEIVLQQLPAISSEQILKEPARRNTAPCLAYASFKIKAINPNAAVVVAPSDHLILREEAFIETLQIALHQADTTNHLLTLGIKPTRPETGFGYIQFEDESAYSSNRIKKVVTFTEKPNEELALKFIDSGDFYWNSGIFIWKNETFLQNLEKYQAELYQLFAEIEDELYTSNEKKAIEKVYSTSPSISVDYGVMEKAEFIDIVLSDFGWSDLGTWSALYQHCIKDENQNAKIGKKVKLYETTNSIVQISKEKTAIIQGLDNYIVVDANNTLLICNRNEEQRIRNFVQDLKLEDNPKK